MVGRGHRKFKEATERSIVAQYINGHSRRGLAARWGCAHGTIDAVLRRHGIKGKLRRDQTRVGAPKHLDKRQERYVAAKYKRGATLDELAGEVGVGRHAVKNAIIRQGGKLRPNGARPLVISNKVKSRVSALWKTGKTLPEIAEALGIPFSRATKIWRESGLPHRGRWGRPNIEFKFKRWLKPDGYVMCNVARDDQLRTMCKRGVGYLLEHRLVMARHIGRPLMPFERVHHKNGIKHDNRIENLELWTVGHKDPHGVRVGDAVFDRFEKQPEIMKLDPETRTKILAALRRAVGANGH